jgi:hypothetical protein
MQNVLAPSLWIFALVYINDIIIFFLTLEDHISHLNQVFKAIEGSGVTLSITKQYLQLIQNYKLFTVPAEFILMLNQSQD